MNQYLSAIFYFETPDHNRIFNLEKLDFLFNVFNSFLNENSNSFEVKTFQSLNDSEAWLPFEKLNLDKKSCEEISTKFLEEHSGNVMHFDTHIYLRDPNQNREPKVYIGIKNNQITKGSLDDSYNDFLSIHLRSDLYNKELIRKLAEEIRKALKPKQIYFLKLPWYVEDELLGTIEDELDLNAGYSYVKDGKTLDLENRYRSLNFDNA